MNITLHYCRAPTKNLLLNPLELQVHNTHRSCTQLSTLVSILNGASILTKLYNCSEPNHILSKQNWNANVVTCLISAWRRCDNSTKIQYHLFMPHQTSVPVPLRASPPDKNNLPPNSVFTSNFSKGLNFFQVFCYNL